MSHPLQQTGSLALSEKGRRKRIDKIATDSVWPGRGLGRILSAHAMASCSAIAAATTLLCSRRCLV